MEKTDLDRESFVFLDASCEPNSQEMEPALKRSISLFLKNYPDGLDASNFCKKFQESTGNLIRHPYFGHETLKAFLEACSDVLIMKQNKEKMFIYPKAEEKGKLIIEEEDLNRKPNEAVNIIIIKLR